MNDLASIQAQIDQLKHEVFVAKSRGDVENVFSTYHYLHNAFQDETIKGL